MNLSYLPENRADRPGGSLLQPENLFPKSGNPLLPVISSSFFSGILPPMMNEATFTDIYELYWEKVYTVCYTNLEDSELAREMVQDIFKSLWERRNTLEITQSAERYLLRAAKLKVFEYIRNTRIRSAHLATIAHRQHAQSNTTENDVLHSCLSQKLNVLVDTMPKEGRRIFAMSRELGLTNKEIAASLSVSERKVEYQLTKALSFLKSNLQEYALYSICPFLLYLVH